MAEKITSLENPTVKELVKLRDNSRQRKAAGKFLIEGHREIELAGRAGVELLNLIYAPELIKRELGFDEEKIIEVSDKVFKKLSVRENPDGFLALARARETKLTDLKLSAQPLIIILEAVEKPGNLGAILRTADAAGVDAVIINDLKTDIFNPNTIRASQGTIFTVPVVAASTEETVKFCAAKKIKIFATTPAAKIDYTEADFTLPSAILLGAEDKGLSADWLKAAEEKIKITMQGQIDSLNVSVTAAVVVFEARRQRG